MLDTTGLIAPAADPEDGKYPRFIREIPRYRRLTPEQVRLKIRLMCEHIRELGDDFTQEKLAAFERIANLIVLDEIPCPDSSKPPTYRPSPATNRGHGFRGLAGHCSGTSTSESSDDYKRVLFQIGESWRAVACADEIQFILQQRTGGKWRAKSYPGSREGLRQSIQRHCGPEACLSAKAAIDALPF